MFLIQGGEGVDRGARGHMPGGMVVCQKPGIAFGDWVAGYTPSISEVNPQGWIETRKEAARLEFDGVIPGYGGVFRAPRAREFSERFPPPAQAAYSWTASYSARILAVGVLGWRLWQGATT